MDTKNRFDFFGTQINATNPEEVGTFLVEYDYSKVGYVSFPDSSVVASAQNDRVLQNILNNALLTLPDGKPSEFFARMKGYKNVSTVSGYWLCKRLLNTSLTHYFLGSSEEKLAKIISNIQVEFPQARVLGYNSPPFYDLSFFKAGNTLEGALEEINRLKPDLIWIGLSSPKQDYLIQSHAPKLLHGVMMGVGGVFDYLSGDVKKSPEWIKKIGLRWLWRLAKEPKRLGAKYLLTMRVFLMLSLKKIFK